MQEEIIKQKLDIPDNFEFPFTPYQIQNDFMKQLYFVIEEGKLGIFESPTGTGKSLSIICGALRWLNDHELREKSELDMTINSIKSEKDKLVSDHDWLTTQAQEIELNKKLQRLKITLDKIQQNDDKIKKLKTKKKETNEIKFKDIPTIKLNENQEEDIEFLLDELQDDQSDNEDEIENASNYESLKIYICSRTHSQISQLVHEVEKSPFAETRLVSLASRQSYCINANVNKLQNPSLINERCLDLQKTSKGKTTCADQEGKPLKRKKQTNCKCPYMQTKNIEQLKESALLQIQDVEQLVQTGKKLNACPYYAARAAVTDAQVIVVPYNLILHQSTREASGIKLKNNVVIIDEAHNLLEALADMHSSQITGHQLLHAHNQLNEYRNKYSTKFSAQNLLYINQLLYIIGKLINVLGGKPGCSTTDNCKDVGSKMWTLDDFVIEADIDHLNLYKILKFCHNSKICQKLNGFALKFQSFVTIHEPKKETGIKAFLKEISKNPKIEAEPEQPATTTKEFISENIPRNPFLIVVAFLESLTHKCEDGRVICAKQTTIGKGLLKFLLLNPSSHFEQIVKECRSVLVAGGTMQPMSEFRDRLFISSGAEPERIVQFSCGHIVPPENILPIVLCNGPTGKILDFSYGSRNNKETLNELGRVLQNVCNIIPGGMVCFFPSYDYEKLVYNHFNETNVLKQMSVKKQIFREPKLSSDVDKVLTQYARAIKNCTGSKNGALMFSVVGGKLSEGLNFSDDLGRCVVVIGMPYPNIKSPELQEKMNYLNKNEGSNAGNIYYENLCMKAVNQCIGRAVRHRNDYANVLLLDKRYSREKTVKALPSWIQRSLVVQEKFGPAFASISKFFTGKKKSA